MTRQNVVAGVIALVVVAAAVGGLLYWTETTKEHLSGTVLRVRTHPIDAETTVVLADIRVTNPSKQRFIIRDVQVFLDNLRGDNFPESEAQRLFDYYPVLGKKYNANLTLRQKLEPGESVDRMVTVQFKASDQQVRERKALRIVITDVDKLVSEIVEDKKS